MTITIEDTYLNGDNRGHDMSFYKDIPDDIKDRIKQENIMVSIVGASIRPHFWLSQYENFLQNNITPFEIIFCGDSQYDFKLPENFHYIYSKVKPAQCIEIAARKANGKFLMIFADDILMNRYCIDNLVYTFFKKSTNDYDTVSTVFVNHEIDVHCIWNQREKRRNGVLGGIFDVPYCSLGGLCLKKAYMEIGGIDKRFIGTFGDVDINLRMYEKGGKFYISPYSVIASHGRSRLCSDKSSGINTYAMPLIRSLWCERYNGGVIDPERYYTKIMNHIYFMGKKPRDNVLFSKKRLSPVEPFVDENILGNNQGPAGRWR